MSSRPSFRNSSASCARGVSGRARTSRHCLASLALLVAGIACLAAPLPAIAQAPVPAAGANHTCALTRAGSVRCWGDNSAGQLGDGTTTSRSVPRDVAGLTSGVAAIAAGDFHTCAVTSTGGVKCWGNNFYGQLGDGTTTNRISPVDVPGLINVTHVVAGQYHTCARMSNGSMKCWGWNLYGQVGDGTTTDRWTPVDVTAMTSGVAGFPGALAAGGRHTCALKVGADTLVVARCWGSNSSGQLGGGLTGGYDPRPVAVIGLIGPSDGLSRITAGMSHTCAVMAGDVPRCWGWNGVGQLGDGTYTDRNLPRAVSGLAPNAVLDIAAGTHQTCAGLVDGVKCWGYNDHGQVGDGTTTPYRPTPVTVTGMNSGVRVTAGDSHSCATTASGRVWCWGSNTAGQLGSPAGADARTRVPVPWFGIPTGWDFDGDGRLDLVWRNRVTGEIRFWLMNGATVVRVVTIAGSPDRSWQIVAAGDFDGDGKADLVWRNQVTGDNVIWFMNGTAYVNYARVRGVPDPNWQIVGAADFDLDGKPDLLWRNQATGENVIWLMNGTEYGTFVRLPTIADLTWTIVSADDFDADGEPEILWVHAVSHQVILWHMSGTAFSGRYESSNTYLGSVWQAISTGDTDGNERADILWYSGAEAGGENEIWRMDGATVVDAFLLPALDDPEWAVMRVTGVARPGSGDFNLDGYADIVWSNVATGANRVWYMLGETFYGPPKLEWERPLPAALTGFRLVGIGDMDGDQKPDLVWRQPVTGELQIWMMNGTTILIRYHLGTFGLPPADFVKWEIVAVGDFNADGKADLMFRHSETGENVIWFMDGPNRIGYTRFTNVPDLNWRIVGTGDFNGDGQLDIVWRNAVSGQNVVWLMNGATMTSYVVLQTVADPTWTIASVRDFDGDGKPDLLWRNTGGVDTGRNIIWVMNGTSLASYSDIQIEADLNWVPK